MSTQRKADFAEEELSEEAVNLLEAQKDVEEVQQIYLNHYRVLNAHKDPAAREYLHKAYDTMIKRAQQLQGEDQRSIYLGRVRVNREIQALVQDLS